MRIPALLLLTAIIFSVPTLYSSANAGETIESVDELTQLIKDKSKLKRRCGTKSPSVKARLNALAETQDCTIALTVIKDQYESPIALVIPVYFHVIYDSTGKGNISDQKIYDQIRVLNEDYRALPGTKGAKSFDTMIQFELKGITRTQNDDWYNDRDENGYKTALGMNQTAYLNIYSNTASGYLGYSYFPQDYSGSVYDGIVINYESVGGRDNGFEEFDQGRTLVHEMGHYLGLYHTFEGGYSCENTYTTGDLIVDTNPEKYEHYSCTQTYSCGVEDPIHNFMNYTPDTCMTNFTKEQSNRMTCSLMTYRSLLYKVARVSLEGPKLLLLFDD